jgi:phage N-6-adenine-methyltransferase
MNNRSLHFLSRHLHPHNAEDDYRTPSYLFHYINNKLGPIQYDAACTPSLNNLAKPLRLEDPWPISSTVYSNPPYDSHSISKWIEKGSQHTLNQGTHIMLIPNKLNQVFFSKHFHQIHHIIFLGGRVNFEGPFSTSGGASMSGSIITVQYPPSARPQQMIIENILLSTLKKQYLTQYQKTLTDLEESQ